MTAGSALSGGTKSALLRCPLRRLLASLVFALTPVALSSQAPAQDINLPVFKQIEDRENRIYYVVPAARHPMQSGYVNPCTQVAFAGIPMTYDMAAVVPETMRDRLAEPSFARDIIQNAVAKFQEVCPEAKMYSTGGPTTGMFSDMNKNKMAIYILLHRDGKLVPYSSNFGNTYEQQFAVKAIFQPSDPPSQKWTWAGQDMENRPQREADERRREADRIRREQDAKQRQIDLADEARHKVEDEKRRVAEAQATYEQKIHDSRTVYDQFNARARIADWPAARDLLANVAAFQGKVIGIRAKPAPTATTDTSVFSIEGGLIYFPGAPSSLAKATMPVLIAGKIAGTTKIDLAGAPVSVPRLDYVDAYVCNLADCEDALFWMNPKKP